MSISFSIKASPRLRGAAVVLSKQNARALQLRAGSRVTLRVGQKSARARVQVSARGRGLRCSPDLARALALPDVGSGLRLHARGARGRVRLGPVIGVFVDRARPGDRLFGKVTPMLEELCRLGRRRGYLVYAFTPKDIRWGSRTVFGYYLSGGRWLRTALPFPDVVYDRVASRTAARRLPLRRAQTRLIRDVGERYFNRRFFDKWEIHQALQQDARLRPYLPPTEVYTGAARLYARVREWGGVWLKPSGGSLGRGILIAQATSRGVRLFYRRGRRWRSRTVASLGGLRSLLRRRMHRGRYVMQKDLQLARYRGRPFDLRILMQRGAAGRWRRTKLYARVAPPRGITSNIAQGGEGLPFRTVVASASGTVPQQAQEILEKIRELSWLLVSALEERTGEPLGEVALDLGIDERGHVWFIEANSKPFRAVETETGSMRVVRRALVRPLTYAAHLAGFRPVRRRGDGG